MKTVSLPKAEFQTAAPFPHAVFDGFLDPASAEACLEEFSRAAPGGWKNLFHYNEHKRINGDLEGLGPATRKVVAELHSPEFIAWLESVTGLTGLVPDPSLEGAGLSETPLGGFLNIHADFLTHTRRRTWSRQLNLIVYLNKDWKDEYHGALELWDPGLRRCEKSVRPDFNRAVLFQTTAKALHGYPRPIACPEGSSRKALALYYYREEGRTVSVVPTDYRSLPGDSPFRRAAIALDRWALAGYTWLKRHTGLTDATASLWLERLDRALRWRPSATTAVILAAAAVRAAFLVFLPVADHGNQSYVMPALELTGTGRYDSFATLHRLPGAPFFFAACFSVFGQSPLAVVVLQHLLGLAGLGLVMKLAGDAWGRRAALAAGVLLALQPLFAYQECFLLSETPAQLYFLAALAGVLALRRSEAGAARWAAAGALAALPALTRGEFLIFGPLSALFLLGRGRALRAAAFLAAWAFLLGGWVLRNQIVFGFAGLTPESATLAIDTAGPLVRYDLPTEPLVKQVFREQTERRASTPGLDPRPTTIERLMKEHGWSYLQAETAVGRMTQEAVRTRFPEYLKLALRNYSLKPARWVEDARQLSDVRSSESSGPWAARFWALLEAWQGWGWVILGAAMLAPVALLRASKDERAPAVFLALVWAGLWGLTLFFRPTSSRIQAELFLPLALLGGFAAAVLTRKRT